MGCLVAQALKHAGAAHVLITDTVPYRLEIAESLGINEAILADAGQAERLKAAAPGGFDIVVDATGIASVLQSAFAYLRPRGKLWVFGVVPPDKQVSFVPYEVFRRDLTIIGSFAVNRTFHESIALIQNGAIQVEPLISHRLPLSRFCDGLDIAERDQQRMKVQFVME
jgi:threonine dehydrogenase-like Zn-dependent dehydrogenase